MIGRYHLNPYELHKHLINEYILKNPGSTALLKRDDSKDKTDHDVIRENHQFVWEADDNADTWEKKLAKKYFDKLFKEYTISDLQFYKQNKLALRWRTKKEVLDGKGQFICGERKCDTRTELRSWEVNFAYVEQGQKKNTLVKLRLCPSCSDKLNYRTKKREIKRLKNSKKKKSVSKEDDICTVSSSSSSSRHEVSESVKITSPVKKADDKKLETKSNETLESSCWTKETNVEEKSREEEFDGYLEDLLL